MSERIRRRWRPVMFVAGAALLALGWVHGPSAEAKTSSGTSIGREERALYGEIVAGARRGEWTRVQSLARGAGDPLVAAFAEWLYLTDSDTRPAFGQITQFLDAHPAWPYRRTLQTKAEQAIPESLDAREIAAWFATREPRTGDGAVRLGEAKITLGARAEGEAIIRMAWAEKEFTPDAERRTVAEHGTILRGSATAARVSRLLWARRVSEANRILDGADGETRRLAKARIAAIGKPHTAASVIAGLPGALRNDSGLLYEQARATRQKGDIRGALSIALKAAPGDAASQWWRERHILAREALDLGLYQEAYRLAAEHGLKAGADFADAEWLAGWVALRFLDKPDPAIEHFTALYKNVSYPVSKSRGAYWAGRAYEAAGKFADAATFYDTAASFDTTYYGQLAQVRLWRSKALLTLPGEPSAPERSAFARSELVRAARIASASGDRSIARPFFIALGEAAKTPEEYAFAGQLALDLGHKGFAVRIGKKAMQDNIVVTSIAYPMASVPRTKGGPEPALVLGITRQESEFDERAESPSGARGLMQLMPATAKLVAKQEHLKYRPARLDDPEYNMRLGTAYLGDLIDRFGGSYALAIAAYNAGPTNARRWIDANGDPRDPKVDPIDWVERITFGETRNYVQRVLENAQVYRSRLARSAVALRIHDDLARPNSARAAGKDLTAYLGGDRGTRMARLEEKQPAAPEPPRAEPEAAPAAQAEAPPAAPEPKPVEVAALEPAAVAPLPPAPVLGPQPKPALPRTAAPTAKTEKPKPAARSKSEPAPGPQEPETAAAAPPPAETPAVNPFGNGQPETMGTRTKCTRLIMDLSGTPRCADRQALND